MTLSERQEDLCDSSRWDFSDLRAVFLNCTLKHEGRLPLIGCELLKILRIAGPALAVVVSAGGCASQPRAAELGTLYNRAARQSDVERNPVIVIPGILGTQNRAEVGPPRAHQPN